MKRKRNKNADISNLVYTTCFWNNLQVRS